MVAVAGVGLSAAGAYSSSKANKAAANANADQARVNAEIAKRNAKDIVKQGEGALFDQKLATIASMSQVRSGTAGAGFTVDAAGTTGENLYKSMAAAGELDITRLQENIDREEQRALDQGAGFTAQADQFKIQARGFNPLLSGFTAAVGGASRNADILFPAKVT
tara:strand:- start:592 stop:1083 length:492 start_codon:yes stop_codon:yes gene_type:complete